MFYDELHVDILFQGGNNRADRVIHILFIMHISPIAYSITMDQVGGPDVGAALEVKMPIRRVHGHPPNSTNPQMQGFIWEQGSIGSKAFEVQYLPNPGAEACPLCRYLLPACALIRDSA